MILMAAGGEGKGGGGIRLLTTTVRAVKHSFEPIENEGKDEKLGMPLQIHSYTTVMIIKKFYSHSFRPGESVPSLQRAEAVPLSRCPFEPSTVKRTRTRSLEDPPCSEQRTISLSKTQ